MPPSISPLTSTQPSIDRHKPLLLPVLSLTRRSQGFATVRFVNAEAAQSGISKWHDQELEGRRLLVFLDKFA